MPRGRNVGFVSDVSARNIAHELGHGAFGLRLVVRSLPKEDCVLEIKSSL
jgi:hypothetical protein